MQIGAGFVDYKLGLEGLQKGVALMISNREEKIANRGWDFKSGQRDFKSWQIFQFGETKISNWRIDYKWGYGLQISAEQLLCHKILLYYKDPFISDRLLQEKYN